MSDSENSTTVSLKPPKTKTTDSSTLVPKPQEEFLETGTTIETTVTKTFTLPREISQQIATDTTRFAKIAVDKALQEKLKIFSQLNPDKQNNQAIIQQQIIDKIHDLLLKDHRGKCIAVTYDGKIIASCKNEFEIFDEVKKIDVPLEQFFIYNVPLK